MAMVGGLDVHRRQITYDWVDTDTGEVGRGRIYPATREAIRGWLEELPRRDGAFAVEATTGWLFVVEELRRAGLQAHLAEPADTRALRGPKRRAKTDQADARHLRELLAASRLPEAWIPPAHIVALRTRIRLYKSLGDERTEWVQRIHAVLFHHGVPRPAGEVLGPHGRLWLRGVDLPPAAREAVQTAERMVDAIDGELDSLRADLHRFARRQRGCRALMSLYGVGAITSVAILAELGDVRRFPNSRSAVRHTGLDITVHSSDDKRSPGRLSRQGPEVLRWALFEAAQSAARKRSPDHPYYLKAKDRLGHNRACLSVARRLARQAYHLLKDLGDDALAPAEQQAA